ncbi:hypothetical protein DPEC_G00299010 [Dallia pectoralis]|uniref:Uncharacterized protein n=1 Tax=Dallia pectoralis TaxID=75939 RepID=A0ACC2FG42_DALPE|nr:hypothetical protein DPEC_G00299010 [Dallia pectoralis]
MPASVGEGKHIEHYGVFIKCQDPRCVNPHEVNSWRPLVDRWEPETPVEMPLPVGSHGDGCPCRTGSGSPFASDRTLEPSELLLSNSQFLSLLDISEESQDCLPLETCLIQDGGPSLDGCVQLERKWVLWHEFMKEYYSLSEWLRLAEQSADSPRTAFVPFVTAKEELKKFEKLRTQAGSRLVQLDSLTRRNQTLTRLFDGTMRLRLAGMTRDCGQRWDRLSGTMERVCRRLKHCVSQREEFDNQREEMAVWLADMDLRLTEVEHFSGKDTCDKMRELQSFQEAVGVNAGRLNSLLERGEVLIQKSEPTDAQDIEAGLQELLLYCAHVFEGVGRLHTRLLSMRLVFDDDWVLTAASDSGCPSETLLEEDGVFEASGNPDRQNPLHTSPAQDFLVLEWDPSVDIGGPVSRDDADSSYFSCNTVSTPDLRGPIVIHTDQEKPLARDCLKRRSYLSSMGSQSDMVQTGAVDSEVFSPLTTQTVSDDGPLLDHNLIASTLDTPSSDAVTFDPCRISAWLGQTRERRVLSLVPRTHQQVACAKAVQTDSDQQCAVCSERSQHLRDVPFQTETQELSFPPSALQSCDLRQRSDRRMCRPQARPQSPEDQLCYNAASEVKFPSEHRPEGLLERQAQRRSRPPGTWCTVETLHSPEFLVALLVVVLVALLVWPFVFTEPECHRSNSLVRSFHLALWYVNGPPPT